MYGTKRREMEKIIIAAIFGLSGGLIRAMIGIVKNYKIKKSTKFKPGYLIITLLVSSFIGMSASLSLETNNLVNFLIGYAGIDLLDNAVKIIKKN